LSSGLPLLAPPSSPGAPGGKRDLTNPDLQENLTDGEILFRIENGIIEEGNSIIMPAYEEKIPSEADRWRLVLFVRELGRAGR
jgi:hypothetical protein